jgi:hypothetical protein
MAKLRYAGDCEVLNRNLVGNIMGNRRWLHFLVAVLMVLATARMLSRLHVVIEIAQHRGFPLAFSVFGILAVVGSVRAVRRAISPEIPPCEEEDAPSHTPGG